ncbi:hypothetical protein KQI68_07010 [Peptoniphilus sp. MSJ-1]|uniref:Uncharacterized protein n=1 Tax=Peptoniphilus ovalis TaxID=2841503 RepID=A0ABS6FJA6_9FIRM|nr:hypothetical protein [Peptoniphilus ovalis]MBU5669587.1 hypothetical protein [Peptoniphilus ovalis]
MKKFIYAGLDILERLIFIIIDFMLLWVLLFKTQTIGTAGIIMITILLFFTISLTAIQISEEQERKK